MNDVVRRIADAVLYEGYLLWPYRRSATKNRQRWTFGCVMPPAWVERHAEETASSAVQCLVESTTEPRLELTIRFLHVIHRQVFDRSGRAVDELWDGGARHLTWQEATERELREPGPFGIAAGTVRESLANGAVERSWNGLQGSVALDIEPAGRGRWLVGVRVTNMTPWNGTVRDDAAANACCSMHLILHLSHGVFVSPLDGEAGCCRQDNLWPVLVGTAPDRSTLLAAAIMLDEYPQVAPESPGDLFDGGEVDQLLTLNIMGMSDEEKDEMRATDPRVRAILDRTERMGASDLMKLHGTFRDVRVGR